MSPPGQKVSNMLLEKSRGNLQVVPERMKQMDQSRNDAQLWMCLVVKVKSNAVKNNIAPDWNVRSMNQGKMDMANQEMAKLNIDILGISDLKWTGKDKCNSYDHYIYYCGQESLRRSRVALIVNKSPKCSTWLQPQKWQKDLCSFPRQTIQHQSNPNLCSNHWCQRHRIWSVLSWPTILSRTNTPQKCPFHHRGLEHKSRKSRDTQNNRQVWPWSTKWSRTKVNSVLSREHAGHRKTPFSTTQETTLHMDITRRSMQKAHWFCSL